MGLENPFGMISRPDESTTYHLWDRFAPHSWCVADSHIPFASLLSRYAPQVVIWRGYAGRLIIPKGFSNPPALYRQDYHSWGFKRAFYPPPTPSLHRGRPLEAENQKRIKKHVMIVTIKILFGTNTHEVLIRLSIAPSLHGGCMRLQSRNHASACM